MQAMTRQRGLFRDGARSFGNCKRLRDTDGYPSRALEPRGTIVGPWMDDETACAVQRQKPTNEKQLF